MTKKNYGGYFVTSHFVLSSRHKTKRWSEIHLDLVLSLYVRTITIFKVRHRENEILNYRSVSLNCCRDIKPKGKYHYFVLSLQHFTTAS